jgi:hypothetical protein
MEFGMEPLVVLVVVTGALLAAGKAGVARLRPWSVALRGGLAAMFVLTGVAHFVGKRGSIPNSIEAVDLSLSRCMRALI